jgi:hypothetical protein
MPLLEEIFPIDKVPSKKAMHKQNKQLKGKRLRGKKENTDQSQVQAHVEGRKQAVPDSVRRSIVANSSKTSK